MKQTWSRYLIIFAPLVIAGILLWPTFRSYQLGKEKAAAAASKDTVRINNFMRDNGESYRNAKNSSVKLGLDLQGGMYVMLEVDIVKLIEESALRESVDETFAEVIAKTKSETESSDDNVLEAFLRNFKAIAEPKGRSLISYFEIFAPRPRNIGFSFSQEYYIYRYFSICKDIIGQTICRKHIYAGIAYNISCVILDVI